LQELRLSGIEGSLISLQNCTSLEILDIADTKVEGDLLSLRNCNFLRELRLYGSQIEGNLTGLQNCTSLERLSLGRTKVGGDLLGLQNCTRLQDLWLDRTRVHGNLNAFEILRNLEFLDLSHTNTSGELESLRHPPHLERFFVGGTKIKGACLEDFDVRAALGELGLKDPELKNLDLHGTKILKFSQWNDCFLVEINLGGRSDISGRLGKKIQQLEGLVALILKGTKVSGDLQTLKNAKDLERLDLSGTEVTGDIDLIRMLPSLLDVDVSKTRVTGQLNCHHSEYSMKPPLFRTWFKSLNVADTNTSIILSGLLDADSKDNFCSRLVFLDLSGTRVENTSTAGLLECLQLCSSLTTLKVTGCKLTGTLPDIAAWPLANPLMSLDLSSNRLSRVEAIPPRCNTFSVLGNEGISFAPGVLQKAVAESVFLDLRDLTLANAEGATLLAELADQKVVQKTRHRTMVDRTLGYACFDIANPRLQISPQKFAPHELCSCSPGWTGLGISCRACPANSFKEDYDGECQKCPAGSEAPEGSITHQECKCKLGDLFNMTGTWKCGCPVQHVLLEDSCMKCERLHLNCSSPGTEAVSAQPLAGYLRLGNRARAFECLSPNTRCIASNLKASHCHDGYAGQLCMECGPGFYASGGLCEQCTESSAIQSFQSLWQDSGLVLAAVAAVMMLALALIACLCWTRPSNAATAQSEMLTSGGSKVLTALKMQLKAQAPLLLQMVQLWSVLAVLATSQSDYTNTFEGGKLTDVANATNTPTNHTSKSFILWELPYVKVVQLSVSNLKGAVNLQCKFDGATVRLAFALAAPVFPLLVLVCCLILEVVNRGAGIAGALQALTLLYVGGASSCADLLSCQDVDGAGETLPKVCLSKVNPIHFVRKQLPSQDRG
jgi:Leucine-rich repeat (LRR) protein